MVPCLSQVCTLGSDFESDVVHFSAAGFTAMELWMTKLEDFLRTHSLDDARALIESHGLHVPVASMQGGLLVSELAAYEASWDLYCRRLERLSGLGCSTIVLAADIPHPLVAGTTGPILERLVAAANSAEEYGIRIALEFQARSALINNLKTAAAIVAQVGHSHLGICLDAFQFEVGPSKEVDLALLTLDNVFHFQISDLTDRPRELAGDGDRILPGDGQSELGPIVQRLREIKYGGPVSLEVMNPHFTRTPADQFAQIAQQSLERIMSPC
ncbi:MAG TPA: sugar phosphate isomerase/epimerase family protein [Pirellulaceae bacterium]